MSGALFSINQLRRMTQVRDYLEAATEWQAATGEDRAYWRGRLRREIARERAWLADGQAMMREAAAHAQKLAA